MASSGRRAECVRQFGEKAGDRYFARTKDRLSAGRARKTHEAQAGHFGRGHFRLWLAELSLPGP
jgi:hypothetical protein